MNSVSPKPLLDCFDDPALLPAAEALSRIEAHVGAITENEAVSLRDALGRILGADVTSPIDVPGHTNSAMDGYAIAGSDLPAQGSKSFELRGTSWAGRPYAGRVGPGDTVQIMTRRGHAGRHRHRGDAGARRARWPPPRPVPAPAPAPSRSHHRRPPSWTERTGRRRRHSSRRNRSRGWQATDAGRARATRLTGH